MKAPARDANNSEESVEELVDRKGKERAQKDALLDQAHAIGSLAFRMLDKASETAIHALAAPDLPNNDSTRQLLAYAASAAAGAIAGAASGWIAAGIAAHLAEKSASTVAGLVSGAVRKALETDHAPTPTKAELVDAFRQALDLRLFQAEKDFVKSWPGIRAQLDVLGVSQLSWLNRLSLDTDDAAAYEAVRRQTMIAWTNFLARARHGAMGPWDHWEENGSKDAIALNGAKPAPSNGTPDPTRSNVSPRSSGWALANIQRPMQDDHHGILEVFVWGLGSRTMSVVDHPGYRMRLDNVGPAVREEFRTMGSVRDLPVNKVIKLCSSKWRGARVDPPMTVASVLITADGHVRASNWAQFEKVFVKEREDVPWWDSSFGQCMDQLIAGKETDDCYVDKKSKQREITAFAEAAQNLPLTYLER